MRYNIGDAVVEWKMFDYIDNPFWFEKAINAVSHVHKADERYFSIYSSDFDFNDLYGCDHYKVNFQEDGRSMGYMCGQLLHVERDKPVILEQLNKTVEAALKKAEAKKMSKIARYEGDIRRLEAMIADLKTNGAKDCKGGNLLELIETTKAKVLEKLGYETP